jgi:methyl-accepting chemotaxis protein
MRHPSSVLNLRMRGKLLAVCFCLFSLTLLIGGAILFAHVREAVQETVEQELLGVFAVTGLAMLASVLLLTFLASTVITRPLSELIQRFESAAAGDLSSASQEARDGAELLAYGRADEVGDLRRAFGKLRDNLRAMVSWARAITTGDLSRFIEQKGELADALNQMLTDLRRQVGQTRAAAAQIHSAVEQLSAASREQTGSAAQQSGSIGEITSTLTELARTSTEVTHSSERVVEIAAQNQEDARGGVKAAEEALIAMEAIREAHESSARGIVSLSEKVQQINEVMDIIDDIADNTKLIAFNAALEAAGAGEAGRRFGVVAQEIRRLADTVVEATEDSRNRIVEIQEATENMVVASERNSKIFAEGFTGTHTTAESLHRILDSASSTTDSARHISLSTQQERTALQQVVDAMTEVSGGAALFASKVSETDGTISDLKELAAELTELMGKYGVDEEPRSGHSKPGEPQA